MKINAINNVMRPVRNVAAAALVAVAPAAVKAEETITPRQFATTNTVNMTSWVKQGLFHPVELYSGKGSVPPIYYGDDIFAKTNEMARVCNVSEFTPKIGGGFTVGGIADGHVATAQLMGSKKLGEGAEWKVIDFLQDDTPYSPNTATKWYVDIDKPTANEYKFFKWIANPDLDVNNKDHFGTVIQKLDVDGNPIK